MSVRAAFDLPKEPVNQRLAAMQSLALQYFDYFGESSFAESVECLLSREDEVNGDKSGLPGTVSELVNDSGRVYTFVFKKQALIDQLLGDDLIVLDVGQDK